MGGWLLVSINVTLHLIGRCELTSRSFVSVIPQTSGVLAKLPSSGTHLSRSRLSKNKPLQLLLGDSKRGWRWGPMLISANSRFAMCQATLKSRRLGEARWVLSLPTSRTALLHGSGAVNIPLVFATRSPLHPISIPDADCGQISSGAAGDAMWESCGPTRSQNAPGSPSELFFSPTPSPSP